MGGLAALFFMRWHSIPVTIVRNRRARKVWLKMRAARGLEVVLPFRVSTAEVSAILDRNEAWILERYEALLCRGEAPGQDLLPRRIVLEYTGMTYAVEITVGQRAGLRVFDDVIRLVAPREERELGLVLLQRWLIMEGRRHLVPACQDLALRHGVAPSRIQIRNQSTRWGSCSCSGGISLNAKLLFFAPEMARHVMLHEFCHVRHRNHGPDFWRCLEQMDPLTKDRDRYLRQAWTTLPAWSKWRP